MQDKRELEKFTRFLALKAAQIIVQSRSGEKISTKCKPNSSGVDWFNLSIQDSSDVLTEAKQALCRELFNSSNPFCVEILLRTIEDDIMVLETWSLGILPEQSDPSIKVTYTVYNRMGMLLKSLLSVSRITPAYKLSRSQGPDSYFICYRVYMGSPQLHSLGDNYKHVKVGQLCTPIGMIYLSVSYRTKMTISPTQGGRDSILLKSDHFHSDSSPKHVRYQQSEASFKPLSNTIKVGAFVDNKQVALNEDSELDIPFSSLLTPRKTSSPSLVLTPEVKNIYASRLQTDPPNGNERDAINSEQQCISQNESRRSSCSMTSANDDFIMVDLKTPFAATNTKSDLGTFYRECQSAPQLQAFMEEQTLAEQVGDLTKKLEAFEIDMYHYEDLLQSLCKSENNN